MRSMNDRCARRRWTTAAAVLLGTALFLASCSTSGQAGGSVSQPPSDATSSASVKN